MSFEKLNLNGKSDESLFLVNDVGLCQPRASAQTAVGGLPHSRFSVGFKCARNRYIAFHKQRYRMNLKRSLESGGESPLRATGRTLRQVEDEA